MGYIYIVWAVLIGLEIARNVRIIEEKKERPIYLRRSVIRVAVGLLFWMSARWLNLVDHDHWIGMPFMMVFTFWYLFDYGLNLARNAVGEGKRKIWYLNPKGSWLDRFQCATIGGAPTWFIFKFFFACAGIWIFQNTFNPANYHWLRY